MFALLRGLAAVSLAGLLGCVLIGRDTARSLRGIVRLASSSPLGTAFLVFCLIPIGVGLIIGSTSRPLSIPRLRILIVHSSPGYTSHVKALPLRTELSGLTGIGAAAR